MSLYFKKEYLLGPYSVRPLGFLVFSGYLTFSENWAGRRNSTPVIAALWEVEVGEDCLTQSLKPAQATW